MANITEEYTPEEYKLSLSKGHLKTKRINIDFKSLQDTKGYNEAILPPEELSPDIEELLKQDNSYFIPVHPVPKPRMTQKEKYILQLKNINCSLQDIERKRRLLVYLHYKDALNTQCYKLGIKLPLPSSIPHLIFFIKPPDSWPLKKKRKMINLPHQQTPDIDNLLKAFFDCLCGKPLNDSYIYHVSVSKYWSNTEGIYLKL